MPAHFHGLDALRGVAALAVVFWHWQHFFLYRSGPHQTTHLPDFRFARQPLYGLFAPLYTDGWRAVELFFSLSGFIFAWLYADLIAERRTTPRRFAVLRFSRLYPLHLATLLFVAAAQPWVVRRTGAPFVYQWNDAYHFVLQLLFVGNWGFERGDSFNGPTWSVSVEILVYCLFFVTCRLGVRRWWQVGGVAGAGFALMALTKDGSNALFRDGRAVFCFYVGALVYLAYRELWRRRPSAYVVGACAVLAAAAWVLVPLGHDLSLADVWRRHMYHAPLVVAGHDVVAGALWRLDLVLARAVEYGFELFVFPLTILALALWESARGAAGHAPRGLATVGALGDLSYASYLLHFPLQLVFAGVALSLGVSSAVFYSPAALVAFFAVLIPLSVATYRGLELPVQRQLRTRLLGGTARAARGRPAAVEEDRRAAA